MMQDGASGQANATMRAIVQSEFGGPEVLSLVATLRFPTRCRPRYRCASAASASTPSTRRLGRAVQWPR